MSKEHLFKQLQPTLPPLYTSLASMFGIETVGPLASLPPAGEWRAPESSGENHRAREESGLN